MLEDIPDWAQRCPTGLPKYTSRAAAKLQRYGTQHRKGQAQSIRAKFCEKCDYWHMTRDDPKRMRAIEKIKRKKKKGRGNAGGYA